MTMMTTSSNTSNSNNTSSTATARYRRYPAYRDSGVEWLGDIPQHWKVRRVSELTQLVNGYPFDAEKFVREGGIPLVRIRDLDGTETEVGYSGPIVEEAWIVPGDVIIGMDGDFNVARWRGKKALLNQRMCCLRPGNEIDAGFLTYCLPFPLKAINELTYSTTVKHLSSVDVRKIRVGVPTDSEQRAIAAFLDRETARIDALIAKKERLIELLQEKRAAVITQAVTKGLDPSVPMSETGSARFPTIPSNWEAGKLRHLIVQVKRPVQVEAEVEYQEIGIRSWGKGIFHKEPLRGAVLEDKAVFRIEPGDFVLNIVFAWEGAVGVATDAELGMIGSHRFPTFRCSERIDAQFLFLFLQTDPGRELMEVNSPGAAGRNKTIRINQFLDEEIPLPPLSVQQEIIQHVRRIAAQTDQLLDKLRRALGVLREHRTALVSAAVTGKIDVREEPEVAVSA